ncbi:MAG TPA: PAS domain S-box protein, partial [Gammaproteobacteria bacterium]|nr:PAS domain S-box protein [Gammaproteobacteria bacterium]
GSDQAMFLAWGPERALLNNDAYGALLGDRHPEALGRPFFEVWPELEETLGPRLERVYAGEPQRMELAQEVLPRYGRSRASFLSLSSTPLRDDSGSGVGAFCIAQGYAESVAADREVYEARQRREVAWEATGSAVFEHAIPLDELTYHSAQWAGILGYQPSELPPYHRFLEWIYDLVHPEDLERIRQGYQDFLAGRTESYGAEARVRHKQGRWIWVRWVARSLERNEDGSVRRLAGTMLDITDLKEREEALRRSEAQARMLARIVQGSPGFVGVSDVEGNPVFVNQAGLDLLGMSWEEARSTPISEYFVPEERGEVESEVLPTVLQEGEWAGELHFRNRQTGSPIPVFYHVYRIQDPETGELTHIATISWDLTQKKEAEVRLRQSEERFRALVEATAAMVWTTDAHGLVVEDSPSWRAFTGQSYEQWQGWGWMDAVHPEDRESAETQWKQATE